MKMFRSESLAIGLAIFSMFFGAGNVIFPLAVGQHAGNENFYAILGLILTAAMMPIAGVVAMILFDGNYRQFFGRLGNKSGFLLALIIISLLGPFGSTPRCIALSYTTLKTSFPNIPIVAFSALSCIVIYLFSVKRSQILNLLGWILTPLLLISLLSIIIIGFVTEPNIKNTQQLSGSAFLHGLKEGYNTMDLLAAFFFSSTILSALKTRLKGETSSPLYIKTAIYASLVGAALLAAVYIGFSYLAAVHGGHLTAINKDELLGAIMIRLAGAHAGILVCITIALACLTTAIALISSFTDFIQKEIFEEKISYKMTLIGALILTFFISIFEFTGISVFLGPILEICYPGLIVLTFLNIAYRLKNFKPIKIPVFFAFTFSASFYFF